jgi:hypothetical protein
MYLFWAPKTHFRVGRHENKENGLWSYNSFANPNSFVRHLKSKKFKIQLPLMYNKLYCSFTNPIRGVDEHGFDLYRCITKCVYIDHGKRNTLRRLDLASKHCIIDDRVFEKDKPRGAETEHR